MSLTIVKQKEKGAIKGHTLLKRKSDALTARFRAILAHIHTAKKAAAEQLRAAAFTLAEVHFVVSSTDPNFTIREAVTQGSATFQVSSRLENVSGVALPMFSPTIDDKTAQETIELTALARGGQVLAKAREAHQAALKTLLELASWQTAFLLLDDVIRKVNRRVNALEYVVIPKLDNTVQYIAGELDEQDREEFFRLKKVQGKKQKKAELEEEAAEQEQISILEDQDPIKSLF